MPLVHVAGSSIPSLSLPAGVASAAGAKPAATGAAK